MKNLGFIILLTVFFLNGSCSNAVENETTKSDNNTHVAAAGNPADDEGKVIHLTKDIFLKKVMNYVENKESWVYEGDKPCVIDFYADWCKPCRMIAPIMEELAEEYKGQIYVYKIDTQKERELAGIFGIRSIPAVLFCPMEGKPQMSTGALPKESFKQTIDNFLLKNDNSQSK